MHVGMDKNAVPQGGHPACGGSGQQRRMDTTLLAKWPKLTSVASLRLSSGGRAKSRSG